MIISPERIPVAGPSITDREVALVADAARNAWYSDHYIFNSRFERAMADYLGVKFAVSVPHCTAALHLALAASGIGPGDEVIVPDVTWIASAAPVIYVGAEPVFVDIRADTWCLDIDAVSRAIGPKTKAIIGVDLYGSLCDWKALQEIAERHDLLLIEDAAEAIGSSCRGRKAGSFGKVGTFSFHGSKTIATGEGGMLVTNDETIFNRVLNLRDHGRDPGDRFFLNAEVGFKYRMNAVTAALGCAQMERIDELIGMKLAIAGWYRERLQDLPHVEMNHHPMDGINSCWMFTVIPDADYGLDKFALMSAMQARNIDTRPFFSPLSSLPAFNDRPVAKRFCKPDDVGVGLSRRGVNLPSGYMMTEQLVDIVCGAFREVLASHI
jgi:perosamine synthetase